MIFGEDRTELRQMYLTAWEKRCAQLPLTPLEHGISDVIEEHPEYHSALKKSALEKDFHPVDGAPNPFLHMGLHLGIREQIATNRPAGIHHIFNTLTDILGDSHEAEHQMIECLADALWHAQQDGQPPDEARYLETLNALLR